jgi:cystathionine gamma-synthase/methionine-gamma-lyase
VTARDHRALHPETLAITAGYDPADAFGAVKPPIVLTSTFAYPSAAAAKEAHRSFFDGASGERPAYIYARLDHPNLRMVEDRMAALDGAEAAAAFASGMAAITATVFAHARPGEAILHTAPLYGGTLSFLTGLAAHLGMRPVAIPDALSEASVRAAVEEAGPVGLVFAEAPANPTAALADIALLARVAAELGSDGRRPLLSVDNTFLGPLLQRPLLHGADLVITSLTKYAGGHSDLLGGSVSGAEADVGPVRRLRTSLGTHLDPFSSWLALRSLETLPVRSARANASAAAVAGFLRDHPKVAAVTYLPFAEGPARAVYERQCGGGGSTFSFRIRGGEAEAFRMLDRLRVIRMAVSLGGTETLICHSATTTHYAVPEDVRAAHGVDASSLRLSVGMEHPDDLVADLADALAAI